MMSVKCQRGLSLVVSTGSKDKRLSLPCAIMRHLTPEYGVLNWETCACSVGRLRELLGAGRLIAVLPIVLRTQHLTGCSVRW